MQFIYDNIMYAELNTKSDYCQVCGYDGEIQIVRRGRQAGLGMPATAATATRNKLNVARRTCGYIGTQFWNQGRTAGDQGHECCICNRIKLAPDTCRCTALCRGLIIL